MGRFLWLVDMPKRKFTDTKERCREWRKVNPNYMSQKRSTFEYKIRAWRQKANARGIEFTVTDDELKSLSLVCAYSGILLTMEVGKENSVSLDRIDSKHGYVSGNIVFCTKWVNRMKQEKSVSDFVEMCRKVVEYKGLDKRQPVW